MADQNKQEPHPEGAAKLADPNKVKPVEPPIEVDESLKNRGAPGQEAGAQSAVREPNGALGDSKGASEGPKQEKPLDETKLPKDENGNPRDLTMAEAKEVKEAVITEMRTIFDPEIPVNIYELGLVYNVSVGLKGDVHVRMTLTSPACPVAGTLPGEVEQKIANLARVTRSKVELVWSPQWDKSMMSEAAKLELNVM
jgi:FeS assembly SUF system protein